MISRQNIPKKTRFLCIPTKPYSFHSVHSAIGSRINGMIFRSFRKRNSSQKNATTLYSEYSYSGIVPKERALKFPRSELRFFGALWQSRYHSGSHKLGNNRLTDISNVAKCYKQFHKHLTMELLYFE